MHALHLPPPGSLLTSLELLLAGNTFVNTLGSPKRFDAHMCGYHDFLGSDLLFNRLDARTDPLLVSPHETA